MVAYAAGVPQQAQGRHHLFEPEAICQTIRALENPQAPDRTKGPFRYNRGPLKGLFKKHFFQASFMVNNVLAASEKQGVGIALRALRERHGDELGHRFFDEEDARLIAAAITKAGFEDRASSRANNRKGGLTGEHLIFAKLPRGNVYLYASFHGEDEQRIVDCVSIAQLDFPDLVGNATPFMQPPSA